MITKFKATQNAIISHNCTEMSRFLQFIIFYYNFLVQTSKTLNILSNLQRKRIECSLLNLLQ